MTIFSNNILTCQLFSVAPFHYGWINPLCYGLGALSLLVNVIVKYVPVNKFNEINNIELIARAHQLVMEGYKTMFPVKGPKGGASQDSLVTVWSAPNYCYRCGNVAAILELDEHVDQHFKIFEAAPQEARGVPSRNPAPDYFL